MTRQILLAALTVCIFANFAEAEFPLFQYRLLAGPYVTGDMSLLMEHNFSDGDIVVWTSPKLPPLGVTHISYDFNDSLDAGQSMPHVKTKDLGSYDNGASIPLALNRNRTILLSVRVPPLVPAAPPAHYYLISTNGSPRKIVLSSPTSKDSCLALDKFDNVICQQTIGGHTHLIEFKKNGEPEDIGIIDIEIALNPLSGTIDRGVIYNEEGWILGRRLDGRFVVIKGFDKGSSITDLGTLGGSSMKPYAINKSGQIVGASMTDIGETHAFLWDAGTLTDLGTLGGYSIATALNNNGQIVGVSKTAYGPIVPFIYEAGKIKRLDEGKSIDYGATQCLAHEGSNSDGPGQLINNLRQSGIAYPAVINDAGDVLIFCLQSLVLVRSNHIVSLRNWVTPVNSFAVTLNNKRQIIGTVRMGSDGSAVNVGFILIPLMTSSP